MCCLWLEMGMNFASGLLYAGLVTNSHHWKAIYAVIEWFFDMTYTLSGELYLLNRWHYPSIKVISLFVGRGHWSRRSYWRRVSRCTKVERDSSSKVSARFESVPTSSALAPTGLLFNGCWRAVFAWCEADNRTDWRSLECVGSTYASQWRVGKTTRLSKRNVAFMLISEVLGLIIRAMSARFAWTLRKWWSANAPGFVQHSTSSDTNSWSSNE